MTEELFVPHEYLTETELYKYVFSKKKKEEIKKANDKYSFLWYDTGLSLDHAINLGSRGNSVFYFIEYRTRYPKFEDYISGYGFNEIHKIDDYADILDAVDVIVFPDVGFASLSQFLRKKGKSVFGASVLGERLENDRIYMLKQLEECDIKVPKYHIIQGKDALLDYAKKQTQPFFVKLNIFRGNFETMKVTSYAELKNEIEYSNFSVFADDMTFIVTEPLDGVEVGCDTFFNGKEFLYPINWGNEIKGTGSQHNKIVEESIWDDVLLNIEPFLRESDYRGAISFEGFFNGENIAIIDVTSRLFYPASSIYPANLRNYDDVIYSVANGEYIKPNFESKYTVSFIMTRENEKRWTKIIMENEELFNKNIFFPRGAVKAKDGYWVAPFDKIIATIVGKNNNYIKAIGDAMDCAKTLKARDGDVDYASVEIYREKYLKELKKYGIQW